MKQKLKKIIDMLRHPEKLAAYGRWLWKMTKPYFPQLMIMLAIDTVGVVIGFVSSFVSRNVVDSATAGMEFLPAFAVMIGISALTIGLSAATGVFSMMMHERFSFGVRMKVFDRMLSARYLGISRYHSGDLMTRLTSDVETIVSGISSAIPSLVLIFLRLAGAFVILFSYSPFLALSALILGPIGLMVSVLTGEKLKKLSEEVKESEAAYRSFMQETLANITVIKTFCAEESSNTQMKELRGRTFKAVLKRSRMSVLMNVLIRILFSAGYFIAFGFCITGLFEGTLTYGTMTLFLTLFSQIQQPIMGLASLLPKAIGILASAKRVMEIESIPEDERLGEQEIIEQVGLRFGDVSFSYGERKVLDHVSFAALPGQLIGVMGPSGVGKTTMIRLVLSLISPDEGRVEFLREDGVELASADARRHIAYVPQGNSLMSGTIADNLRLGAPEADEAAMYEALDRAEAGFVRELPQGMNTLIGEKAVGLSEGQAQRIAIARALVMKKPILIFDEATSALDEATEARILERIANLPRETAPLCLIITHRSSMKAYFDQLIEIREDGSVRRRSPENF